MWYFVNFKTYISYISGLISANILEEFSVQHRVSVQGVKSLGDHFACLCQGLNFMK